MIILFKIMTIYSAKYKNRMKNKKRIRQIFLTNNNHNNYINYSSNNNTMIKININNKYNNSKVNII